MRRRFFVQHRTHEKSYVARSLMNLRAAVNTFARFEEATPARAEQRARLKRTVWFADAQGKKPTMKHFGATHLTMTIMLVGLTRLIACSSDKPAPTGAAPAAGTSAAGTSSAGTSSAGTSAAGSSSAGTSAAGSSNAGSSGIESSNAGSSGIESSGVVITARPIDYSEQSSWRRLGNWTGEIDPTPMASVDVFFVYPSTFFPRSDGMSVPSNWNQSLAQAQMDPAIEGHVYSKAGVFFDEAGKTNLYVPFYRQAAGNYVLPTLLYHANDSHSSQANSALYVTAYSDVSNAFEYYLAHYNKDPNGEPRPFILAGHSQGSNLLLKLLLDKFADAYVLKDLNGNTITDGKALRKQLIAAYAIGWSVTSVSSDWPFLDMEHLKANKLSICNKETQTGCIVTYNTQQDAGDFSQARPYPGQPGSPPTGLVQKNAYSVNPLTWVANGPPDVDMDITSDTEPTPAGTGKNLGALFFKLNDVMPYWHLGLGSDSQFNCNLRPQLGPFTPLAQCPSNCPNCPGSATGVAASPDVVEPSWLANTIANWLSLNIEVKNYTGAQNIQGALVIDPNALPAPGNYKNLNPPYNTSDATNDLSNVNNPNNQPPGWYHNYDYSFFWRNLERNAKVRTAAWLLTN
ncbi:MAG TPA: DUF3089 domain-containing protein [Polyangiaceae bacterium]